MLLQVLIAVLGFVSGAFAAFGITTTSSSYTVDAGSENSLVFSVSRANCDITSILYRGTQLQYPSQGSHIGSGLGSASVSATTINAGGTNYAKITCTTSTLTHYYVVRAGESTVYMATYVTAEPSVGELRYIARLSSSALPSEYPFGAVSTTAGGSAIEGSDVFLVNGQTRSKFYSSERFIDDKVHCIYGNDIRACMVMPQYESSSGGPFFRDINSNNGGGYNALYWYMNSGHAQTEPYRMGLHGPYALVFSRSGTPGVMDTSFFSQLSIQGYVPTSSRGYVSGSVSGVSSDFERVVHWYNSAAQYWTKASSGNTFVSPAMKQGTYTMVLYQGEYKVATTSVTVPPGSTTTRNIASSEGARNTIWRIGEWDGQPKGFRNAANQLRMHPSDSRMASWGPLTYTVGSSSLNDVPMALFKSVGGPLTIKFTLSSSQLGAATLRIGTTLSFSGGRPQARVNNWTGPAPPAPTKIDSRGVTRGAYRGLGEVYTVSIPSGTLVAGTNTIAISVISGSDGTTFLSPNFILDAVELHK